MRPYLGTYFQIQLSSDTDHFHQDLQRVISEAFGIVERWSHQLNFHSSRSDLSALNQAPIGCRLKISQELLTLLFAVQRFWQISQGAFAPWTDVVTQWPYEIENNSVKKKYAVNIDLGGLAKGFIVDEVIRFLDCLQPTLSGIVNAGGDLRFLGKQPRIVDLRLGSTDVPLLRKFFAQKSAIATSSLLAKKLNGLSKTRYRGDFQVDVPEDFTIVAVANECLIADAFTKIGLFAKRSRIEDMCRAMDCLVIIFDKYGQLNQAFGEF